MAFNPAEASSLILAGRLPETVRSFVLRRRHHRQHPFRGDPVQRRAQGRGHGRGRLPALAGGAGAQAGRRGLGRPDRARPRGARARGPGALREPGPRAGDPAARSRWARRCPSRTRPGWCCSSGAGPSATAAEPLSRLLRSAPPLTIALFLGPVACGLAGTAWPAAGRGALAATCSQQPGLGARRRCSPSAAASAPRCWRSLAAVADRRRAPASGWPPARAGCCCPCSWRVPHLASAIGTAFLLAPSGWLARLALALAHRLAAPARPAHRQRPAGVGADAGPRLARSARSCCWRIARGAEPARQRAHRSRSPAPPATAAREAWLKLVLPRALPADPPAALRRARLRALGRRHGAGPRARRRRRCWRSRCCAG